MGREQWWNGDYQGECDNVLPDQGYRWVGNNGGMMIIRGNVIMCCLTRAIVG